MRWEGHVRECACGKLAYGSLLDALRAISRLTSRPGFHDRRMHAYRSKRDPCRGCWHLTSQPRRWHRNGKGYVTGHA